jgi:RNA polymerase sigma-70 factor (ECF subfamily)
MTLPPSNTYTCHDEESFVAFHHATSRGLWSYLHYLCRDRAWADDLVQETYLHFLQAAPRLKPGDGMVGYLYRIGTNLYVDQCRRRRLEHVWIPESHSAENFPEPGNEPQQAMAREIESQVEASTLLSRLKGTDRLLLWLAYGAEYKHQEIARYLGVKEASVKVLLFRARRRLMDVIRRKGKQVCVEESVSTNHK